MRRVETWKMEGLEQGKVVVARFTLSRVVYFGSEPSQGTEVARLRHILASYADLRLYEVSIMSDIDGTSSGDHEIVALMRHFSICTSLLLLCSIYSSASVLGLHLGACRIPSLRKAEDTYRGPSKRTHFYTTATLLNQHVTPTHNTPISHTTSPRLTYHDQTRWTKQRSFWRCQESSQRTADNLSRDAASVRLFQGRGGGRAEE